MSLLLVLPRKHRILQSNWRGSKLDYCTQTGLHAHHCTYMKSYMYIYDHLRTTVISSELKVGPSAVTAFPLNALMASGNRCLRSWPSCVEEWVQLPLRRGVKTNLFSDDRGYTKQSKHMISYDIIIFHHISGYWSRAQKANAPVILPYSLSISFLRYEKGFVVRQKHAVGTILHFCSSERIFFLAASTCMSLRTGLVKTCVTRRQTW